MDERLRAIAVERKVFLRKDAFEVGYTDRAIRQAVKQRQWHRVRAGAYVPMDIWSELNPAQRHQAAVRGVLAKAHTKTVISHTSAAVEWDVPTWNISLDDVHTTRTDLRAGRREAGVCQHRGRLPEACIVERNGVRVTDGTRTALDVTTISDSERGLIVVNGLLRAKATDLALLWDALKSMERRPHSLGTRVVLRLADARIESVGESRVQFLCFTQGLPQPVPQVWIEDQGEAFARVDFAWPELKVFLEFDGKIKYTRMRKPGQSLEDLILDEKRREERICEVTGWRCIRVTWADLADPAALAARIRRLFKPSATAV